MINKLLKKELIEQIKEAFSVLPYPGDHELTVHPLGLDESFYEAIRGKSWKVVDPKLLNFHNDCIGVLTPKGFQYYLPGFLVADLIVDFSAIFEQLTYLLSSCQDSEDSPINNLSGRDWLIPRIKILSKEQKNALIKYFKFYKAKDLIVHKNDINKILDYLKQT